MNTDLLAAKMRKRCTEALRSEAGGNLSARVMLDHVQGFAHVGEADVDEQRKENPEHCQDQEQHGDSCHHHRGECPAENLNERGDDIFPEGSEEGTQDEREAPRACRDGDLQSAAFRWGRVGGGLRAYCVGDVELCFHSALGAGGGGASILSLEFDGSGTAVAVAFSEHRGFRVPRAVKQRLCALPSVEFGGQRNG